MQTTCFKAYDVRGKVPHELNEYIAYRIGYALVQTLKAKDIVVGQDMRLESASLSKALMEGITDAGADVIFIGLCGTEEVYFNTQHYKTSGGVMITASHNPKGYNGMKFVGEGATPISNDSGLLQIKNIVDSHEAFQKAEHKGHIQKIVNKTPYLDHLLTYVDIKTLKPLKILADPGNGMAGPIIEALSRRLPFQWVMINANPDGNFPNGVPNPLLPENRKLTQEALIKHGCDLGLAWDGDFDRCFFFDENGRFIEGYYLVGLLARIILKKYPGEKIIHDPRLTWNTIEQVEKAGGKPIQSKTGHAFIKEKMRAENAVYGGEMSAHHYFREFAYCDSGMIPWLLVISHISQTNKKLSDLVDEYVNAYPCSGEINFNVKDTSQTLSNILQKYQGNALQIDETDGLSVEFREWRFSLRSSNTEPLMRLNVESRGCNEQVKVCVSEIGALINSLE